MKKIKGSITVFLSMMSIVIIIFSLLMIDIIRVIESSDFMSDSLSLSVMAADNCYNKEIFKELDIIIYTMSDEELSELIIDTLYENASDEYFVGLKMSSSLKIDTKKLTNGWMYTIADLLSGYRNRMGLNINEEDKYYCPLIDNFDENIDRYIGEILCDSNLADIVENHTEGKNFYQLSYEYLIDMNAISDDKYSERFSTDIMEWCYGTERIEKDFEKADTDYSVAEEMETAYLQGKMADNRELGFKWYNDVAVTIYENGSYLMDRYDAANIYSWKHFNSVLSGKTGKSGLNAEIEYLLYGNQSDRENIAKVLSEIFKLRMYMNLKSMLKAGKVNSDETIIEALNESWFDVLSLYAGKMVEWEKDYYSFVTNESDSLKEVEEKVRLDGVTTSGMSYEDYLKAQFYLSCYSGQICCNETLYADILDIIGFGYDIDVRQAKIGAAVNTSYSVANNASKKAFTSMGKIIAQNKKFSRTYYIGGY